MMRKRTQRHGPGKRRGSSLLIESSVALLMLVMAMTLTVQILGAASGGRRAADRRDRARIEVGNVMEQIAAHPFDQVTPELAKSINLSEGAKHALPSAELRIAVSDAPEDSRRISVQLRYRARSGEWESPVVLVSWINRAGGRP